MTVLIPVQLKRKTAAAWTAANPVLLAGEPGFEEDTGKLKIGNGVTPWAGLFYIGGGTGTLTGATDPSGILAAPIGTVYTEIAGGVLVALRVNLDGGTTWSS